MGDESKLIDYLFVLFVNPRILRKGNLNTVLAKRRKEVSVLDLRENPQRIIPGKTHSIK